MEVQNNRLNEQFEKSKKNVLNESMVDINKQFTNVFKDQKVTIESLQSRVDSLLLVESAYNSDKKMYSITVSKLNGDIEGLNSKLTVAHSEKSE